MNPRGRFPTLAALVVLSSSASYGATIIGTVTGPPWSSIDESMQGISIFAA
jgi:hypothetical protein